jgi:hypothetical protein
MKEKFYLVLMLTVAFLMGGILGANAQNTQQTRTAKQRLTPDQIAQRQCDQMVNTLMLDDATAAKFTPVYKQYLNEMWACRKGFHKPNAQTKNGEKKELSDAEIDVMIKERFAQSRKMIDVREKYYTQLRKVLSPRQIQKIYQTELRNKNKMNNELKKRHFRKGMNQRTQNKNMPQQQNS